MKFSTIFSVLVHTTLSSGCLADHIRADEEVTFMPATAYMAPDGRNWIVPVEGWVYEPEKNSLKRRLLVEVLQDALDLEDLDPQTPIFARRVRRFLVDDVEGRRITIQLNGPELDVGTSGDGGYFRAELLMSAEQVRQLLAQSGKGDDRIRYRASTNPGDDRVFEGQVQFLGETGYSVVSDIDDTIKISQVTNHQALAENTFLKEFQIVPGMAEAYRKWEAGGARFHYVSASPWQLYEELAGFLKDSGFPSGSFSLKQLSSSNIFESARERKLPVIEDLFRRYPQRKFILVGDSGQEDPEIYAQLARAYPQQVAFIAIRSVRTERATDERYRQAFRDVDPTLWRIFREPSELESYQPK